MNSFQNISVTALHNALINKKFTSVELTEVSLSCAKKNSQLNAFITLCDETAIASAEKADKLIQTGKSTALSGIPLAIKDNICTKGIRTTCASKMLNGFIPPYDATAINRLKKCGSVIIGKTNMDEFAMGSSSKTSFFKKVYNPKNTDFVAGGSSSGSAAAVSQGICPAALGSDTGGSIRQPASFCGVTAIKPTYGTISRYGLIAFASSLDQIGIIANFAEDCALILNVISGKDKFDSTCNPPKIDYTKTLDMPLTGKIIGLPKEFFGDEISDEVKISVLKAAEIFKTLGCVIKEVSLPVIELALASYSVISSAEAASNLARYDGIKYGYRSSGNDFNEEIKNTRGEGFGLEVKRRIMLGNHILSSKTFGNYYDKALNIKQKIKFLFNKAFEECNVILSPTAPTTAFPVISDRKNEKPENADILTLPASLGGFPVVTTNCSIGKNNLPIGMSITAPMFCDSNALAFAHLYEKAIRGDSYEL